MPTVQPNGKGSQRPRKAVEKHKSSDKDFASEKTTINYDERELF